MKDDKRLKRKVRQSYAISTISIALVLLLLGSVSYLILTAMDVSHSLRDGITATVELKSDVGASRRDSIQSSISSMPIVRGVEFFSKEAKVQDEEFRKLFGDEFEAVLGVNPLLDSFEVEVLSDDAQGEVLEQFIAQAGAIDGVDSVTYPVMLVEKVRSTLHKIELILFVFGGALLFISLILLNNTIRLAIFSRRYIINTMKLVGATKWFIMRPLLWSGVKCGFGAGVMASAMFLGVAYALDAAVPELMTFAQVERLAMIVGAIVVSGVVISLFFTIFAVNKFVNMKSNKIYIY